MRLRGNTTTGDFGHTPVMLTEVLQKLSPHHGATYIDGTFGAGGYTRGILNAAPKTRVFAIDQDPDALARGKDFTKEYGERFHLAPGNFADMESLYKATFQGPVDGVVLDIGVSSQQLDTPERGFSFQTDGPLDMRMSAEGPTAADVVNTYEEAALADILWRYGEEKKSRAIARAIVKARADKPFQRTTELVQVIHRIIHRKPNDKIDPATRTFQALRIHVNRELDCLEKGLQAALDLLHEGGRLVVVTFHSLEDRIAKQFFRAHGTPQAPSRYAPQVTHPMYDATCNTLTIIDRRPVTPTPEEIAQNPRARSAKLRWGIKKSAPIKNTRH